MIGWLTPDTAGGQTVCRVLVIPLELLPAVGGALGELADPDNWEPSGSMTPDQAAELAQTMIDDFYNSTGGGCP